MTRSTKFQTIQAISFVLLVSVVISGNAGATKARTSAARLRTLEAQVAEISQELATANDRITTLESVTQLLDQEGTYYGYVNGAQVWSHYCEDGASATWKAAGGLVELSCPGVDAVSGMPRRASGFRLREGSPFRTRP